jgi:glycosyltransferase involved in cell wall biosynthesis
VDLFVANSAFIGEQVGRIYGRESQVLHPFAQLSRFLALPRRAEDFYLMVGAFAPYKRVDLAIEAFNRLGLPLWIVGGGQEEGRLRAMAGPTIRFLGSCDDATVADLYSRCRAFVFPGVEDFGITPLEAMASGAPVVALGQGGALETVTLETGVFFAEQTVDQIEAAILRVESTEFQAIASSREQACRARARAFDREAFKSSFKTMVEGAVKRGRPQADPGLPSS